MDLNQIEAAVSPRDVHFPYTRLISLENTHNACGGCVLPLEYTNQVVELARKHELKVHLDGARIFNAAAALNVNVKELTSQVDSVNICLSKGLAAPVGAVLCGANEFISKARRMRKITGGGMRQCGVLAAAGLTALNEMVQRLAEDHENASILAQGLTNIKGLSVNLSSVQTNIVYFNLDSRTVTTDQLVKRLNTKGIKVLALGPNRLRAVTHYGISSDDIDRALYVFAEIFQD
jgi:threonine aldolase